MNEKSTRAFIYRGQRLRFALLHWRRRSDESWLSFARNQRNVKQKTCKWGWRKTLRIGVYCKYCTHLFLGQWMFLIKAPKNDTIFSFKTQQTVKLLGHIQNVSSKNWDTKIEYYLAVAWVWDETEASWKAFSSLRGFFICRTCFSRQSKRPVCRTPSWWPLETVSCNIEFIRFAIDARKLTWNGRLSCLPAQPFSRYRELALWIINLKGLQNRVSEKEFVTWYVTQRPAWDFEWNANMSCVKLTPSDLPALRLPGLCR